MTDDRRDSARPRRREHRHGTPAETLRVAVVGSSRFGVGEPFCGGLEAHTVSTVRALERAGHSVTLFAGPADEPAPDDINVIPIVETSPTFAGHDRIDIGMSRRSRREMADGYRVVMDAVDDPSRFDVVHNNSLHPIPVERETTMSVAMVHVLHCPPTPELVLAHERRTHDPRRNDLGSVIAVSDTLAGAWPETADVVVPNGVPLDRWHPVRRDRRSDRCAWTGRIIEEKAPHLAIRAARAAGMSIMLAGPIQSQKYFDREVAPLLGSDATYLGHLDHLGLVDLFSSSTVGVVTPRWDEPFGLVAAEMLACGLPVAAFDRGALSSIVSASVGRLAVPDDVADLARCILDASALDRERCRVHAVHSLSDDRMAERYVELYRQARGLLRRRLAANATAIVPLGGNDRDLVA